MTASQTTSDEQEQSLPRYVNLLHSVERAQRQLHDAVAAELMNAGIHDVTAVQAMLLFHLGREELTAAEIMHSGRYLGSNVSYNLKKLAETGRLDVRRDTVPHFSVSDAGRKVQALLWGLFNRQHASMAPVCGLDDSALEATSTALRKLERYWTDQVRYRL